MSERAEALQADYDRACQGLAALHAAAMGASTGLKRGVVDDVAELYGWAQKMDEAAEMLWTVVANVSGGDWTQQSPEWQEAAARWRDHYFAVREAGRRRA